MAGHEDQHHGHHHTADVQHVHAGRAAAAAAASPVAQAQTSLPGLVLQHAAAMRGQEVDKETVEDGEGDDGHQGG